MEVRRSIQAAIEKRMFKRKAIILVGARQVGKSTLFSQLTKNFDRPYLMLNCDDPEIRQTLENINLSELKLLLGSNKIILIDEAQRIENIGLVLKMIVDNFGDVQVMATGSSSLDLLDSVNEPLTGRKYEFQLFPIATKELYENSGLISVKQNFENRLIYGSYPEIISHAEEAKTLLTELSGSYLYKDLLTLDDIRKPAVLEKILVALALQVGSEVSYNEIAQTVGTDSKTVEKYIDLLEKCFVIFRLSGLSRNLRNELKKSKKIYFYDVGIRNAILQNYSPLPLRQDAGSLWENFFICERMKKNAYEERTCRYYFWRTTAQQEIDFLEEEDGAFTCFEIKYNPKKARAKLPKSFAESYNIASFNVVTPENYLDWVL